MQRYALSWWEAYQPGGLPTINSRLTRGTAISAGAHTDHGGTGNVESAELGKTCRPTAILQNLRRSAGTGTAFRS